MVDLARSPNILLENDMEFFSQMCRYLAAAVMDPDRLQEVFTWHALLSEAGGKDGVSQKLEFMQSHPLCLK